MFSLQRLRSSIAARNAAASYFAFFAIAASAFLSIPVAVAHLEREQIGLWAVVNQICAYLMWMDLGVGGATGRKMADAIAQRDQLEINRWWTATRCCLYTLGLTVIGVGLLLLPMALDLFRIPNAFRADAQFLLTGAVILIGVSFPLKGVPGLMTAQQRFYWIPLIQGLAPWISLGVFYTCLRHGLGIRSYLIGMALANLASWSAFLILIKTSEQVPRWDRSGISKARLRSLFSFSLNISGISLINAIMQSLPAMLIARAGQIGGLAVIPQYNFTTRGPIMISNLVHRTSYAFHPSIQRLYVDGHLEAFGLKFQRVAYLSISIGLAASGCVILSNRMLVELLAGPTFYGGSAMTLWLAVGVICAPIAIFIQNLRIMAAKMGKALFFSFLKLLIAIALAIPSFQEFGLAGLAAVFMLVPLIDAAYGYYKGSSACGFKPHQLCGPVALSALGGMALVLFTGYLTIHFPGTGPTFLLNDKTIHLPGTSEWIAGMSLIIVGGIFTIYHMMRLKDSK